jgi:hypothetical protein
MFLHRILPRWLATRDTRVSWGRGMVNVHSRHVLLQRIGRYSDASGRSWRIRIRPRRRGNLDRRRLIGFARPLIHSRWAMRLAPRLLRRSPWPPHRLRLSLASLSLLRRIRIGPLLCRRILRLQSRQRRRPRNIRRGKSILNSRPGLFPRRKNRCLWRRRRSPLRSRRRGRRSRADPINTLLRVQSALTPRLRLRTSTSTTRRRPVLLVVVRERIHLRLSRFALPTARALS